MHEMEFSCGPDLLSYLRFLGLLIFYLELLEIHISCHSSPWPLRDKIVQFKWAVTVVG